MTQNPNRNMAKGQEQKRNERRPDENKAVRPENAQKNVQKTERRENPVKAEPRVEGKPRTEEKSAPAADTRVSAKAEIKPEAKPETKPEVKPEVKPEGKPEIKSEAKAEIKPEVKAESKPEGKAESKPESKPEVKPESKAEQKSAFKTGDRGGKPTHTSVVREVNIISGVQLEEPDTTETKKYTPKTVEKKRDTHQKTVVREVNILSDIPAADPNASPFRTAPGWDKKAEKKAETVPETVDTAAARAESVAEAVELPIAAAVAEDIADELVEIGAASMEASAAENADDAEKAGDAADAETKFSRHTDDESLSMDELLGALPENVREPDRKKVGVTAAEMNAAVDFVNTLLRDMQIDAVCAPVACPEGEEYEIVGEADRYPAVEITGSGSGILIGHHGETLDAIQCLLNLASIRKSDHEAGADYVKIALDIENYRAKREETLRALAKRMAARAVKYKRNVFLEPMNAYERRIIHSELQGVPFVSTHSVGTDKNRKIIITYEGPDKKPMGSGAPKKRRPNAPADSNPQAASNPRAAGEENAERSRRNRKPGGAGEKKDRPRPPKPQKLPIESLPDFLANPTEEPIEHLREN